MEKAKIYNILKIVSVFVIFIILFFVDTKLIDQRNKQKEELNEEGFVQEETVLEETPIITEEIISEEIIAPVVAPVVKIAVFETETYSLKYDPNMFSVENIDGKIILISPFSFVKYEEDGYKIHNLSIEIEETTEMVAADLIEREDIAENKMRTVDIADTTAYKYISINNGFNAEYLFFSREDKAYMIKAKWIGDNLKPLISEAQQREILSNTINSFELK